MPVQADHLYARRRNVMRIPRSTTLKMRATCLKARRAARRQSRKNRIVSPKFMFGPAISLLTSFCVLLQNEHRKSFDPPRKIRHMLSENAHNCSTFWMGGAILRILLNRLVIHHVVSRYGLPCQGKSFPRCRTVTKIQIDERLIRYPAFLRYLSEIRNRLLVQADRHLAF